MSKTQGTQEMSYEKATRQFLPASTILLVTAVLIFIFGFLYQHPFNESFAHQIATALITVDGLILGFTILGVTVVAERGFSRSRMTDIFEKHLKKFLDEFGVAERSDAEKAFWGEKLESTTESAVADIISVHSALFVAMYFLLTSLLSALMLFGISDNTVSDPIFVWAFRFVMIVSVNFLILGFHLTIQVLKDITMKTNRRELDKAFGEAFDRVEQDLKKTRNTKKE